MSYFVLLLPESLRDPHSEGDQGEAARCGEETRREGPGLELSAPSPDFSQQADSPGSGVLSLGRHSGAGRSITGSVGGVCRTNLILV